MGHEVVKCKFCKDVIRQCRCPGPHPVTWSTCAKCAPEKEMAGKARVERATTDLTGPRSAS